MSVAWVTVGRWLLVLVTLVPLAVPSQADEFRPAYLELKQVSADSYDVVWKVPSRNESQRLAVYVRFPDSTVNVTQPQGVVAGGRYVERWRVRQAGGLTGREIRVDGLAESSIEVLVRVQRLDGGEQVARMLPSRPAFTVLANPDALEVSRTYTILGVEHILTGTDHLLFVFALLLLVRGGRRIVVTITAFTVAHSITLAGATLGYFALPPPPVEAVIALSIAFLAREIVISSRGRSSLTERRPWLIAFTFGLLHGLGFAGALAEVGLPQSDVPLALLCFNLGVEIGQLFFVGAVLLVIQVLRRWSTLPRRGVGATLPYLIGGIASFWLIQRVVAFG